MSQVNSSGITLVVRDVTYEHVRSYNIKICQVMSHATQSGYLVCSRILHVSLILRSYAVPLCLNCYENVRLYMVMSIGYE